MADFLSLVESVRQEQATSARLYADAGRAVRGHKSPNYLKALAEATSLVAGVVSGRVPMYRLQEAMSTSDFPNLFGDILDRQLLANYRETPQTFRNYCRVSTVRDFRTVNRFVLNGGEDQLEAVAEATEYPAANVADGKYSYAVKKYGKRIPFTWEALVNDDLDAFRSLPERLARAARRTEEKFATDLFVGTTGPDTTFFAAGNANIVTSNPVLSVAALQTAMSVLAAQTDSDGEPILIEALELVVPPALGITALNILNALQLEVTEAGGTSNQKLITTNWMKGRVRLSVNPYIPIIASSSNGSTSWFLFANPNGGRPAVEVGFLAGHVEPELFIKAPNAQRVGGGSDAMNGDFESDAIEYKLRHVLGGTTLDPRMAVASNGSGS